MRILMVSDVYFPRINGVSTSIQTFVNELNRLGHEVTLLCPDYRGNRQTVIDKDHRLVRIPSKKVLFDPEDRYMSRRRIYELLPWLQQQKFDLLHIQTPFVAHYMGVRLAERLGLPSVVSYHTFFEEYLDHYLPLIPKRILRGLARRFSRKQCNQVERVIVPSSAMRDVLLAYGVKTTITILPTGIPLEKFKSGDGKRFRHKYGIAGTRPLILTIGRVACEKNIDFLVDVLVRIRLLVPEILFVIAGEGPMLPELQRRIERENLEEHILLVGYLDRETELQDCYAAADIFVFASRTETQGLVLLEAMAKGIPLVSTAVMGTRDVLVEKEGCLIAPDEAGAFAARVVRLLGDASLRRQLSRTGREYVKRWHAPLFAEQLLALYRELTGEAGAQEQSNANAGITRYRTEFNG